MKRLILILLILLLSPLLFSSITLREDLFNSQEELEHFNKEPVNSRDEDFYSNMKIYLLTGSEGSMIWENFGHSAFVIETPSSPPLCFDYGIFTFDKSFFPNFILGKLYYEVYEGYALYRVDSLIEEDRSVTLLELDLDENQKKAIYTFLLYNVDEENKTYLYDYFLDNCSTRLRDIYSYATDGEFYSYLTSPCDETLRESVNAHLSRSTFFVAFIINYLLGPSVDKGVTNWDMCYLPKNLERAIESFQNSKSETIYQTKERKETPKRWNINLYSLFFSLSLVLLALLCHTKKLGKVANIVLFFVLIIFGIMSLSLIFLSLFTIHNVTHNNLNVLIISPLCLLSGILHLSILGGEKYRSSLVKVNMVMLALVILTVLARLVLSHLLIQNIWAPVIVALPLYITEALLFSKKN